MNEAQELLRHVTPLLRPIRLRKTRLYECSAMVACKELVLLTELNGLRSMDTTSTVPCTLPAGPNAGHLSYLEA